jgi:phage baseplate assembly protein W
MYNDYTTVSTSATNVAAIKQSIKNILLTPKGSLPGKPNFGSNIHQLLFSQMDGLTMSVAQSFVEEALREFEDRIVIESIDVIKEDILNKMIIKINFSYLNADTTINQDTASVGIAL